MKTTKKLLASSAAAVVMAGAASMFLAPAADAAQFALKIGGAEAAGFFKEATGFDSESEVAARRAT